MHIVTKQLLTKQDVELYGQARVNSDKNPWDDMQNKHVTQMEPILFWVKLDSKIINDYIIQL